MTPRGVGRNLEAVEDICFIGEEVEVGKEMAIRKEVVVGKAAHICLTLNIIDLKFSVEHDRVVTTLNLIKH
jgi:UDP-3-O-[3-hydroxymyristoyl] glucosamine N-acyltransferase